MMANSKRIIETLSSDLKSVNVWSVPKHVTLDEAMRKQDKSEFRALYFKSSHLLEKK